MHCGDGGDSDCDRAQAVVGSLSSGDKDDDTAVSVIMRAFSFSLSLVERFCSCCGGLASLVSVAVASVVLVVVAIPKQGARALSHENGSVVVVVVMGVSCA